MLSPTSPVGPSATGRNLTTTAVLTVALVVQVSVANRLPLPGAVAPDLVLLVVVALALVYGPMVGLVTGFCAGLTADIVPSADHTIGRYALVYCAVGYLCGLVSDEMDRSRVWPFVAVASGALVGTVLYAGVGMLLDDPRASWSIVSRVVPLQVLYDVLASPFVVWAVLRVTHRVEREHAPEQFGRSGLAGYRSFSRERV